MILENDILLLNEEQPSLPPIPAKVDPPKPAPVPEPPKPVAKSDSAKGNTIESLKALRSEFDDKFITDAVETGNIKKYGNQDSYSVITIIHKYKKYLLENKVNPKDVAEEITRINQASIISFGAPIEHRIVEEAHDFRPVDQNQTRTLPELGFKEDFLPTGAIKAGQSLPNIPTELQELTIGNVGNSIFNVVTNQFQSPAIRTALDENKPKIKIFADPSKDKIYGISLDNKTVKKTLAYSPSMRKGNLFITGTLGEVGRFISTLITAFNGADVINIEKNKDWWKKLDKEQEKEDKPVLDKYRKVNLRNNVDYQKQKINVRLTLKQGDKICQLIKIVDGIFYLKDVSSNTYYQVNNVNDFTQDITINENKKRIINILSEEVVEIDPNKIPEVPEPKPQPQPGPQPQPDPLPVQDEDCPIGQTLEKYDLYKPPANQFAEQLQTKLELFYDKNASTRAIASEINTEEPRKLDDGRYGHRTHYMAIMSIRALKQALEELKKKYESSRSSIQQESKRIELLAKRLNERFLGLKSNWLFEAEQIITRKKKLNVDKVNKFIAELSVLDNQFASIYFSKDWRIKPDKVTEIGKDPLIQLYLILCKIGRAHV